MLVTWVTTLSLAASASEGAKHRRSQLLLLEATRKLAASIDYPVTLKHVAGVLVPQMADFCMVQLFATPEIMDAVEVVSVEPEKTPLLEEVARVYLADLKGCSNLATVLNKRSSQIIRHPDEAVLRSMAKDARHFDLLKRIGFRTLVVAPLHSPDRVLGAVSVGFFTEDRTYDAGQISVIEELCRRAAMAIENSQLYKQTQQAVQTRDEFLSIASHELKTPLTSLTLQLQLLGKALAKGLETAKGDEVALPMKTVSIVTSSEKQVKRLSLLLDSLLDLTRIRLGRLQLNRESVDLGSLANEILQRQRPVAAQSGVALTLEATPGVVGSWDRMRIEQLVLNLISNAIKYGEEKPVVVFVKKDDRKDMAVLEVSDRGPGIAPEQQQKIFERFVRADATGTRSTGLGLGLYICRQIAESHQGTIRVSSEPGAGSTFIVELPLKELSARKLPWSSAETA
jgi:signal transduction histidine kinase